MRLSWRRAALWLALLGGCDGAQDLTAPRTEGPRRPQASQPAQVPVTITVEQALLGARHAGPVYVQAEALGGRARQQVRIADHVSELSAQSLRVELNLAPGRWRLVAFVDRNHDGEFQPCPFPPGPEDALRADRADNFHALRFLDIPEPPVGLASPPPLQTRLRLERHLCGLGETDTGLMGTLSLGRGLTRTAEPVWLRLEPLEATEGPLPYAQALRFLLFPGGMEGSGAFRVGQILPGRYRAQFYADGDRDDWPSPCALTEDGRALGGGDRFLSAPTEVVVESGRFLQLQAQLDVRDCPAPLTGLSVSLQLAPLVREAVESGQFDEDPLHLAFYDAQGREIAKIRPEGGLARLAEPLTLTGLPAGGPLRLVAWLDRDGDGAYGPCDGLGTGLDLIFALRDDLWVEPQSVRRIDPLTLDMADCDLDVPGLRGTLHVPVEEGSEGSGRAVRLELIGVEGDRLGLPLFEHHWRLPPAAPEAEGAPEEGPDGRPIERVGHFAVTAQLPPGRYRPSIYLDTDRNGQFTPCDAAGFGDRAALSWPQLPEVELRGGALFDLGVVSLKPLDCGLVQAQVAPQVLSAEEAPQGALRLLFEEAGGWQMDYLAAPTWDGLSPIPVATRRLAAGQWKVTAYFDSDGDGRYRPDCATQHDTISAQASFTLEAARPTASPQLRLRSSCGP